MKGMVVKMGRPRLEDSEKKTKCVRVFLTEEQYENLGNLAYTLGRMKIAELMRAASLINLGAVQETGNKKAFFR